MKSNLDKIAFCFDGTCNDPRDAADFAEEKSITNVLKLHAFLGGGLGERHAGSCAVAGQQSHYYKGVGTRGNVFQRTLNSMFAPRSGDMKDILDHAASDLEGQIGEGQSPDIYIFGFSRGAAIARMFAAQVARTGRKIKFLGVFDTVAATKKSLDLKADTFPASGIVFENGTIADEVERAVHLLSIDENRVLFQPTLFNHDDRVHEVWFAGFHSDVGGGFWCDGLSDICLEYMMKQVGDGLTFLPVNDIDLERLRIQDSDIQISVDDLYMHAFSHGMIHEKKRTGRLAEKTLVPRVIRVNENDLPSADRDKLPIIHHTVAERFYKVAEYRPYMLRGLRFKIEDADGTLQEKSGIAEL